MKKLFTLLVCSLALSTYAQVGIGTVGPTATLDVVAANPTGLTTGVDGVLVPRVTRERAKAMLAVPTSTLIYVAETATGTATGTAINITTVGFYYFDGAAWIKLAAAGVGTSWSISGNGGTAEAVNYIGTTNATGLTVRTNNVEKARFTTQGQLAFLNSGNSVFVGNGAGAVDDLTANVNVFVGENAGLANTTGSVNVAIGAESLKTATTNQGNTAIGYQSMMSSTGSFNTAIGRSTLTSGSGTNNIAIGLFAMQTNGTGSNNIAMGNSTLDSNTTGSDNVAIGDANLTLNTTGSRNVAVGKAALNDIGTQNDNVGIGNGALAVNGLFGVGGDGNVAIGSSAGSASKGSRNIYLGRSAGALGVAADNDKLYIESTNSNTPLIGGDFATDKLGINTPIGSITHTLTVGGNVKIGTVLNLTPGVAPGAPATGDVYYDSASNKVKVWTGAIWENLN
jgi:trimeric autotransporter adhesin